MIDLLIASNVAWFITMIGYIGFNLSRRHHWKNIADGWMESRQHYLNQYIRVIGENWDLIERVDAAEKIILAHGNVIGLTRDNKGRFAKKEDVATLRLQYHKRYGTL